MLRADPVEGSRGPTHSILAPVQSNRRPEQRLGYVLSRVRSRHVWPEDWVNRRFGELGHLVVFDATSGTVLYHTRAEWIGRDMSQADPELLQAARRTRAAAPPGAAASASGSPAAGAEGGAWAWVPGGPEGRRVATILEGSRAPWTIVATAVPGEFAIEARRAALFNLLVAGGALFAAAAILVVATGRRALLSGIWILHFSEY